MFAAAEVLKPNSTAYLQIVDKIEADHILTVEKAIPEGQILQKAINDIKTECQKLRSFLSAAEVIRSLFLFIEGEISSKLQLP